MQKVNSKQSQRYWSKVNYRKVNAWLTEKVNTGQRKSQRPTLFKVNVGQLKKSTANAGQSQQSTLGLTWIMVARES